MWDATKRIHPDEMPPPDALINYPDGSTGAAMFHYLAAEDGNAFENVVREHGFDIKGHHMDDDHPLMAEYSEGSERSQASGGGRAAQGNSRFYRCAVRHMG